MYDELRDKGMGLIAVNGFDKDEDLINYMDIEWDGGIPGTFVFDKSGKLKKTFIGKTSYKDFKAAVKNLL